MKKVFMYVDGYNFYYAIKQNFKLARQTEGNDSLIGLGWCDFRRLGEQMIDPASEELTAIKYFTARVNQDYPRHAGEKQRQDVWLNAIRTISGLSIIYGHLSAPRSGEATGPPHNVNDDNELKPSRKEYQTDVNIAIELVLDALDTDGFHRAILITADTDLAPAVHTVMTRLTERKMSRDAKLVNVWLTPFGSERGWHAYFRNRTSRRQVSIKVIREDLLSRSLLPYEKQSLYSCPQHWRLPTWYLDQNVPRHLRPDLHDQARAAPGQ